MFFGLFFKEIMLSGPVSTNLASLVILALLWLPFVLHLTCIVSFSAKICWSSLLFSSWHHDPTKPLLKAATQELPWFNTAPFQKSFWKYVRAWLLPLPQVWARKCHLGLSLSLWHSLLGVVFCSAPAVCLKRLSCRPSVGKQHSQLHSVVYFKWLFLVIFVPLFEQNSLFAV